MASELKLPAEGGCRCGAVRIRVSAAPILTMACHCSGCQKMSSSAYSLTAAIPSDGFSVTQGTTVPGGRDPAAGHHFCPSCMTWMFTRPPGLDWFVNLRPTMLDDPHWFAPFIETFTNEKLHWAATAAVRSFDRFPAMGDLAGLMQDHAAQARSPGRA